MNYFNMYKYIYLFLNRYFLFYTYKVDTPQSTPLAVMVDKALPFFAVWQVLYLLSHR